MIVRVERSIPAPVAKVYAALVDPETIRSSVEGVESITPAGQNAFELRARGGIRARVTLAAVRPEESLTIGIEARSLAGSLKASVQVRLAPGAPDGTLIDCSGDLTVGGLLLALGSKGIENAARQAVGDFLSKLSARLTS